jgi:hypothetical protein
MVGSNVSAEGPFDFVLQDRRVNPTVELGLTLAEDDQRDGIKRWEEGRVSPIPPRRSSGALSWTHKDPLSDFVFAQDSWAGGALQPYYRDDDPFRYATANNIDARWDGVLALGSRRITPRTGGTTKSRIQSNLFVSNGDFEEGQTSEWTAGTGVTLAVDTGTVRTGTYSGKATLANGTAAGTLMYQDLANPLVYRGHEITVIAYIRRDAGSDSAITLRVNDGANNNASQGTVGTSVWTYQSITFTVDSSANQVRISIEHDTLTAAEHTFYIDDIHVIPTGGVEVVGKAILSGTDPDEVYIAGGRWVAQWDETNFVWDMVVILAVDATDIIEFNGVIFAAFGDSVTGSQYWYGSGTSWTESAINATGNHNDNYARFWVKARNAYGEWALWKASPSTPGGAERHAIFMATDATNTGDWSPGTAFTVGSANRYITRMAPFKDSFVVMKVDGIWLWDATTNDFVNIKTDWEHSIDEANGDNAQEWSDGLYFSSIRQGFHHYNGQVVQELSPLLMAPRLTDFGGRITALTACARELFIGLDTPTADTTTTKTSRLAVLNIVNNRYRVHILSQPNIGLIDQMFLHQDTRLWVIGRTYNSDLGAYISSMHLYEQPDKVAAPYADVTPSIEQTGFVETSIWHGGMPETDKALWALTIWCEDLDEAHTIQADFGTDGRSANNSRLGIFNKPDRVQTLYFANLGTPVDDAVCRFVQLRFTFTTDDTTSPKIYAFALHTILAPEPLAYWDLFAYVGDKTLLRSNVPSNQTKSKLEELFLELERQIFPPVLLENFGLSYGGDEIGGARTHYVRVKDFRRVPNAANDDGQELYYLRLQNVPVGAEDVD